MEVKERKNAVNRYLSRFVLEKLFYKIVTYISGEILRWIGYCYRIKSRSFHRIRNFILSLDRETMGGSFDFEYVNGLFSRLNSSY